jgi:site-specific DNA-methyltransferase (adenine-specific)
MTTESKENVTGAPPVRSSAWLDAIVCADCLNEMPKMPAQSVDAIISDLPYGTTACKWDSVLPFAPLWAEWNRLLKPGGAIVLTSSQPFTSALVMSNPKDFRHEWIWEKAFGSNFMNACREPLKEHESVLVFSRGKWTYNAQREERSESGKCRAKSPSNAPLGGDEIYRPGLVPRPRPTRPDDRLPSSVQKFNNERGLHPTQKPLPMMRYLVRTYTNPGDVVLDPCCGSGTTCVAAKQEGRHYIGIEKEQRYADSAKQRTHETLGMASNDPDQR